MTPSPMRRYLGSFVVKKHHKKKNTYTFHGEYDTNTINFEKCVELMNAHLQANKPILSKYYKYFIEMDEQNDIQVEFRKFYYEKISEDNKPVVFGKFIPKSKTVTEYDFAEGVFDKRIFDSMLKMCLSYYKDHRSLLKRRIGKEHYIMMDNNCNIKFGLLKKNR